MENSKNYYAEEITNDKNHKLYWANLFVQKWIKKLGLSDQPFRIVFDAPDYRKIKHTKVGWKDNCWQIDYKHPLKKYVLIHELGHVYLDKILNLIEYKKQRTNRALEKPIEKELWLLIDALEDCFVNYNLSNFPEYYRIKANEFKNFVCTHKFINGTIDNRIDPIIFYFLIFLEYRFILRDVDRSQIEDVCKFHLKELRAIIIEDYKKQNKKFSYQKFQKLDKKLLEFNELKDLSYLLKENSGFIILAKNFGIVKFYYDVVKCLGLFNSNLTKNFLWEKYGIKPNTD